MNEDDFVSLTRKLEDLQGRVSDLEFEERLRTRYREQRWQRWWAIIVLTGKTIGVVSVAGYVLYTLMSGR